MPFARLGYQSVEPPCKSLETLFQEKIYVETVRRSISLFSERNTDQHEVLIFPPSTARARYLIHQVINTLDIPYLKSVSIGEEPCRRVVVYFQHKTVEGIHPSSSVCQTMTTTKDGECMDGGYLFKGTVTKPSPEKMRRPERELYTPRHRRPKSGSLIPITDKSRALDNEVNSHIRINPVTGRVHRTNGHTRSSKEKEVKKRLVSSESMDAGAERKKRESKTSDEPVIMRTQSSSREKMSKKLKDLKLYTEYSKLKGKSPRDNERVASSVLKYSTRVAQGIIGLALEQICSKSRKSKDAIIQDLFDVERYATRVAKSIMQHVHSGLEEKLADRAYDFFDIDSRAPLIQPSTNDEVHSRHTDSCVISCKTSESADFDAGINCSNDAICDGDFYSFDPSNEIPVVFIDDTNTSSKTTEEGEIKSVSAWSDRNEANPKASRERSTKNCKEKALKKKVKAKAPESTLKQADIKIDKPLKEKKQKSKLSKGSGKKPCEKNSEDSKTGLHQFEETKVYTLNSRVPSLGTEGKDDDWDSQWDDEGKCLDPKAMKELAELTGITKPVVKRTKIDYHHFTPQDVEVPEEEYGHIIEVNGFAKDLKTSDICIALSGLGVKDYNLQWVDDTHALAVFSSVMSARSCLRLCSPILNLTPISKASRQSKLKARLYRDALLPYKPRPETSAFVARNLVTSALGIRASVDQQQRVNERKKLRDAREKKRQKEKEKADMWGD